MSRVYISYSRNDESFVQSIVEFIEQYGVKTWLDVRDIRVGEPWREALIDGVVESDAFMMFLSSSYLESEMCRMEAFIARSHSKRIIPIIIDDTLDLRNLHQHQELKGIDDLQFVPWAWKNIIGLPLNDDDLRTMIVDTLTKPEKTLASNLLYFAYPKSSATLATRIADDLRGDGFPIWIGTRDHNVGRNWQQEQWAAMMNASAFIIILDEAAPTSIYIRQQVIFAQTRKLPIIPILAAGTDTQIFNERVDESWEMRAVTEIQWLTEAPDYQAMFNQLKDFTRNLVTADDA